MALDVYDFSALRAAVLIFKRLPKSLRSDINKSIRDEFNPVWQGLVQVGASRAMETKVLTAGTRVKGANPPVLQAATSTRAIGEHKGILPARDYAGWEFGAVDRNAYSRYERKSKNGGTHKVERRTMRHLPSRNVKGRVVYPAVAEIVPRIASFWVQSIYRFVYAAFEGKG